MMTLTGTQKQIEWATKIRALIMSRVGEIEKTAAMASTIQMCWSLPTAARPLARTNSVQVAAVRLYLTAVTGDFGAALEDHEEAGWWIDARSMPFTVLARVVADEIDYSEQDVAEAWAHHEAAETVRRSQQ